MAINPQPSIMDINSVSKAMTQGSPALQKEAFAFFENLKSCPDGWKLCMESILTGNGDETRDFFCLLVIEHYIKSRYENDLPENQATLRQFVFSWFSANAGSKSSVILNKFASIVDDIFLVDFPASKWNSFFQDFMRLCHSTQTCFLFLKILMSINSDIADRELNKTVKENERNNRIKDMIRELSMLELAQFWFNMINTYRDSSPGLVCLCLEVIGVYVAWIEISLITNECFMSTLFDLFQKVDFRCSVCECFNGILHKGMDPIIKTQLIESFVNVDAIKNQLTTLINNGSNGCPRDEDFMVKLSKLVNTIGLELIESFKKLKPKQNPSVPVTSAQAAIPATMVNGTAPTQETINYVSSAIESKFGLLCFFLNDLNPKASLQVHSFAREYIQWIKNQVKTSSSECISPESMREKVNIFCNIIISRSKYPLDYDYDSFMSCSDDELNNCDASDSSDHFMECRKSARILFENLMLLDSNLTVNIITHDLIDPVLTNWKSGGIEHRDIEVALYMFYLLGENLNMIQDQKQVETLLQQLISSNVSSFNHPLVRLSYFELIIRYEKFFSSNLSSLLPQILVSFLDERGFKSSHRKLRSRVCQLFNKFIKVNVKGRGFEKIQGFTEDIMKRLSPLLKPDAVDDEDHTLNGLSNGDEKKTAVNYDDIKFHITADDQLLLYETIASLIISNTSYDQAKKYMLLKNCLVDESWKYFDELYVNLSDILTSNNGQQANGNTGSSCNRNLEVNCSCRKISHVIGLVARTSKAFSNVHPIKSINCQSLYLDSFNTFIKVLSLEVGEENLLLLQSSLRLLLHRLIVCLEESEIVPLIPVAIERIFLPTVTNCNMSGKIVQELMPLINQIVTKFKHSWMFQRDLLPFLKQMFLPLVSSIFNLTSSASTTNDAANPNNVKAKPEMTSDEIQSLHKCYYTFLSVLASNNVMEVFSTLQTNVLEQIMVTLVQGAVEFPDVPTQKSCFLVLRKLIECQASAKNNALNMEQQANGQATGQVAATVTTTPIVLQVNEPVFVEFMYNQIFPACFYSPLKQVDGDQNSMLIECISCLKAMQSYRGNEEFLTYLGQRFLATHFASFTSSNEMVQAFLALDQNRTLKVVFRKFVTQFKK